MQITRIIIPSENLFVNPSWDLGVKEAKNDIIALLNDDIIIPDNFCSTVVNKMTPDMGIVGMNVNFVHEQFDYNKTPTINTNLVLKKIRYRCPAFGIAIFFFKSSYSEIPNDMKIYYGDDWIFLNAQKMHKTNYCITNQTIYHLGSLSSGATKFNSICKKDKRIFKHTYNKWYDYLFSIMYVGYGYKVRILGLAFIIKAKKGTNHE